MLFHLLVLLGFAVSALASVAAAPYEAIYFYQAYLLEYAAKSGQNIRLGWGCFASGGGHCSFDEFTESVYTDRGDYVGGWDPSNYASGTTVDEMASDLSDAGFSSAHYNPEALRDGLSANAGYTTVMRSIANSIQASRQAGVSGQDLDRARDAIQGIVQERLADNVAAETDYLVRYFLEFSKYALSIKSTTTGSGREYLQVDWAESYNSVGTDPTDIHDFETMARTAVNDFQVQGGDADGHNNLIQQVRVAQDRIWNADNTC